MRGRLTELDRRELIGLVCVGLVIVAAAGLWYVRSLPKPVRIEASAGPGAGAGGSAATSPHAQAPPVVVDVAGWVRHPGVYEMHQGDRVIDALDAAGGAKPGADLTSLNLASMLQDAQQVLVLRRGAGGGAGGGGEAVGGKINVNTATLDQLESLPGIGEVLGQRILDYRQARGPFRAVDDLLNVSGIGPSHLADLKDLVTV